MLRTPDEEIRSLVESSVTDLQLLRQETVQRESRVMEELNAAAQRENVIQQSLAALAANVEALTAKAVRRRPLAATARRAVGRGHGRRPVAAAATPTAAAVVAVPAPAAPAAAHSIRMQRRRTGCKTVCARRRNRRPSVSCSSSSWTPPHPQMQVAAASVRSARYAPRVCTQRTH